MRRIAAKKVWHCERVNQMANAAPKAFADSSGDHFVIQDKKKQDHVELQTYLCSLAFECTSKIQLREKGRVSNREQGQSFHIQLR